MEFESVGHETIDTKFGDWMALTFRKTVWVFMSLPNGLSLSSGQMIDLAGEFKKGVPKHLLHFYFFVF